MPRPEKPQSQGRQSQIIIGCRFTANSWQLHNSPLWSLCKSHSFLMYRHRDTDCPPADWITCLDIQRPLCKSLRRAYLSSLFGYDIAQRQIRQQRLLLLHSPVSHCCGENVFLLRICLWWVFLSIESSPWFGCKPGESTLSLLGQRGAKEELPWCFVPQGRPNERTENRGEQLKHLEACFFFSLRRSLLQKRPRWLCWHSHRAPTDNVTTLLLPASGPGNIVYPTR